MRLIRCTKDQATEIVTSILETGCDVSAFAHFDGDGDYDGIVIEAITPRRTAVSALLAYADELMEMLPQWLWRERGELGTKMEAVRRRLGESCSNCSQRCSSCT